MTLLFPRIMVAFSLIMPVWLLVLSRRRRGAVDVLSQLYIVNGLVFVGNLPDAVPLPPAAKLVALGLQLCLVAALFWNAWRLANKSPSGTPGRDTGAPEQK